ncbi:MAG: hypothetical protein IJL74_01360 [Bacilli bacterium]|nr:hypothetical protein [Bacilli bacterium]
MQCYNTEELAFVKSENRESDADTDTDWIENVDRDVLLESTVDIMKYG